MNNLHSKLVNRYNFYRVWHNRPYNNILHWATFLTLTLAAVFIVFGSISEHNSQFINLITNTPYASAAEGDYQLPADRAIPWSAGSDQWNGGTLPNYTSVTCTGLTEGNGTTNNGTAIQTCLNSLGSNQ